MKIAGQLTLTAALPILLFVSDYQNDENRRYHATTDHGDSAGRSAVEGGIQRRHSVSEQNGDVVGCASASDPTRAGYTNSVSRRYSEEGSRKFCSLLAMAASLSIECEKPSRELLDRRVPSAGCTGGESRRRKGGIRLRVIAT